MEFSALATYGPDEIAPIMTKYGAPIADDYSVPRAEMTNHASNAETSINPTSSSYENPTQVAPISTSYGVPQSDVIGQYSDYDYAGDVEEEAASVAPSSYGVPEASSPISTSYGVPSAEPISTEYSSSVQGDYGAPPPVGPTTSDYQYGNINC